MSLGTLFTIGKTLIGGSGNPITDFATNFLISKALGGDTKDAIAGTLLQQGLGSAGLIDNLFGKKDEQLSDNSALAAAISNRAGSKGSTKGQKSDAGVASKIAEKGSSSISPIKSGGIGSLLDSDFLKSPLGMGLAAVLADKLFGSDDAEGSELASMPFGGVEGYTKLNVPRKLAAGGTVDGQYFPRRNGGIMPSEGSGQKDDVPAMLMAGEFVLNKNAVRGLGDGDLNKGIERAYAMQNKLASKGA
tara:strand:- start:849 stop:1589 length:741 start_codon:yes stop_codon:yes gene_type:complete